MSQLEKSVQNFTTEYLKASQNYFDKPESQGLSKNSAEKLNKLLKEFNKELDEFISSLMFTGDAKDKLTEEQKREEIKKIKASLNIDVLDKINFKEGDPRNEELDEFIQKINELNVKKLSGELKSPAESDDFKTLENIQRSKDLADYIKETCSVNGNYIENLQKDKILKDYLKKINFNPEFFNKEKEEIEKRIKIAEKEKDEEKVRRLNQEKQKIIDEYFQKLALEALQKNPLLFKSLEENTAFKQFIDRKNKEFENNNKDLFKGIDPKERKDVVNAARIYNDAGDLNLKDALFLAKIAYKVAFPHTILTGLAVKGLQKMGVFDKAHDYLKSSINDLKGKNMFQKAIPLLKISAIALVAGGAASILVAANPELLDKTFDGAKSIMSQVADTLDSSEPSTQANPEIKLTDTIQTEKSMPQDDFNKGIAPIDSSLAGSNDYQEKTAFNAELQAQAEAEKEKVVNDYIKRVEKEFNYDLSIASKDPTEILNAATLAAEKAALEASNLPPVSAQEAAKAAFGDYEKAILAAEQTAKGLVTIEPTTAFEKSLIGRGLPEGNIYKTGAMDIVKELNPHIADPDKIYPGQEIKLPLFGKDELGNRIITGFEVKTVSAGDTMSEMYVNSAKEQLNNLNNTVSNEINNTVSKNLSQVNVKDNTFVVDNNLGQVHHVDNEGNINTYQADEKGVVKIGDNLNPEEELRQVIAYTGKEKISFVVVDEEGKIIQSKATTLERAGFVSHGVDENNHKVSSLNVSGDVLAKVQEAQRNGEMVVLNEKEYNAVLENHREFERKNPIPDRAGTRIKRGF